MRKNPTSPRPAGILSVTLAGLLLVAATAAHPPAGPRGSAVEAPAFDVTRGFFTKAFTVTLRTATAGASIRYTTDGSAPGPTAGTLYTGPVTIARTTALRAIAYAPNQTPSAVVTHTYIILDDVLNQTAARVRTEWGFPASWNGTVPDYGMDTRVTALHAATIRSDLQTVPSLSISLKTDDLFGTNGIYSNPLNKGTAWERPASLELIDPARPDGSNDFQIDCGLRIHGGAFRRFNLTLKKSFRVLFKDTYGPTKLRYPMFGPDAVQQFDTLVFRMESNDGYQWGNRTNVQYARDEFMRRTQLDAGSPASRGRYLHLYLNGVYWGLYNTVERPDASFGESYFGAKKDEWDGVNTGSATNNGSLAAWYDLTSLLSRMGSAANEQARTAIYMQAQGLNPDGSPSSTLADRVDIDNYIDYLLVNWYGGNADWPNNNYYFGRERDPLDAPGRQGSRESYGHHFFCWDAEWVLLLGSRHDSTGITTGVCVPYGQLRASEEFRVRFGDRAHRLLFNDGALTSQRCLDRYAEVTKNHRSILIPELARWGDQHGQLRTINDWIAEYGRVRTSWLATRTPAMVTVLQNAGLYPRVAAPSFNRAGGRALPGTIVQISAPAGQIYYTTDGSDPRALGGAVGGTALAYAQPVRIDVNTTLRARVRVGTAWSALHEARYLIDTLTINEVLARNDTGIRDNFNQREDWIEVFNPGPRPVDAGGLLLGDDGRIRRFWPIPGPNVLQPGTGLVVWADEDAHQGPLHAPFKLSTDGGELVLYDADGRTLMHRLQFGPQVADVSTGGLFDGAADQVTFMIPTPGKPNAPPDCGSRFYSALDSRAQTMDLFATGQAKLGQRVVLTTYRGAPGGQRALLASAGRDELAVPFASGRLLVANPFLVYAVQPTASTGSALFPLPIPNLPVLDGQMLFLQAWGVGPTGWDASNGVVLKICR